MADEKPSTSATLGASSPVTDIIPPNIPLPPKLELSRNLSANCKKVQMPVDEFQDHLKAPNSRKGPSCGHAVDIYQA